MAVNDAATRGPVATVISGVAEEAIPAVFDSARRDGNGIVRALAEQRASVVALQATPPGGVPGVAPSKLPPLAEHATLHVAVEGISYLAARALRDGRRVTASLPPEIPSIGGIVEPPSASEAARGRVREAGLALLRSHEQIVERAAERIGGRDRAAAEEAARALAIGLLPASVRTGVYLTANARVLQQHCEKLLASPQAEVAAAGRAVLEVARAAVPGLLPEARPSKMRAQAGAEIQAVLAKLCALPEENASATMVISQPVRLVRYDKDALERVALALAYEGSDPGIHAFALAGSLRTGKEPALLELVRAVLRDRGPGELVPRGFESSTLTFEIMADSLTAQDLVGHRRRAVSEQRFTCRLGFQTPEDLLDLGLADMYQDTMLAAQAAWSEIDAEDPVAAEYAVPLGFRLRTLWTLDLRQLVHIVEARTTRENPTRVRRIAQALFRTSAAVMPWLRDVARVDLD